MHLVLFHNESFIVFGEQAGQTKIVNGVKPPGVIDHGEVQGDKNGYSVTIFDNVYFRWFTRRA